MNPLLMLILAVFAPIIMAITLLLPLYAGIAIASYVVYSSIKHANPLAHKLGDVPYMIEVYSRLYSQWAYHSESVHFWTYTFPLLLFPIAGLLIAFWLTRKVAITFKNLFQNVGGGA